MIGAVPGSLDVDNPLRRELAANGRTAHERNEEQSDLSGKAYSPRLMVLQMHPCAALRSHLV
jgi:hypothetical protein